MSTSIRMQRLWQRLQRLSEIGREEDGLTCLGYSQQENEAHQLARGFMEEAGLRTRVDAAGNLIGRKEGRYPGLPVVMTGSHLDTVYGGGMFDGRLGVIAAIEALQCLHEAGIDCDHPIEVWAYRNEEGCRFNVDSSGAEFIHGIAGREALSVLDREGCSLEQALRECGIDPERIAEARLPQAYAKTHIELHIEQGAVLESLGLPVGIVTGINSHLRAEYTISGQAAHAGATPMNLRRDPLPGAAEIILHIEQKARAAADMVATTGWLRVFPGGINVIPERVQFSLDLRHLQPKLRDELLAEINAQAEAICRRRRLDFSFRVLTVEDKPMPCAERMQNLIAAACDEVGLQRHFMPSGAGHDTGAFSGFCPIGMIFVRTKDGLSHNGAEYASPEDCALGAEVLLKSLVRLAARDTHLE